MLERILEPEVMDTMDEAVDYDSMDHSQVNRQFVEDLLAAGAEPQDVLDLGTGTAQIPIVLCDQCSGCRVMAVDLSIAMLEVARFNIEAAGHGDRIELRHVDAKRLSLDDATFDVVMSNSIVHHVPEPETVMAEAVRLTSPGGRLFFRDLLRPADKATLQQLVDTYTGNENQHQQKMFADSLHAALTLEEVRAIVVDLGFAADTVRATSDRHWTWSARKPA